MVAEVKIYTVNGPTAGSSSSLPDWLTRKRISTKGKRAGREHVESTLELIQGFEFPEASNRIKTTRDGNHAIATGTYKPQMRVWDLDQLTLKFERHSNAENIDFVILSDDWTKSIHLQNDRTIELHTQGGFHYRTRIPRSGRSLAYHFSTCDAYFSASGNEIYRLNLEQGRFMNPLVLQTDSETEEIIGVNTIDINPAHQLLAFGIEGNGTVQFWDPRSRTRVGVLRLPKHKLMPRDIDVSLSVMAISSRADGLSYAFGTSTGHTLLYDIRTTKSFAMKDQGYGLPVKNVAWIESGSRMAGDGMVLTADKKVIKIWDRNSSSTNFASITPAHDLNHVHHVPSSGLLMIANEGIQMAAYYIPQLGPAPRWASFLENITEEMEDQTVRSVYEDYKFIERSELNTLGLDHLIGTPTLKPYMHGYFISLKFYDAARVIANPFAYTEHREKLVREKMEKMAEARIRTKKNVGVKVNKALAEKILRDEEKAKKREERRKQKKVEGEGKEVDDNADLGTEKKEVRSILNDPRFSKVFEDPEFAIDAASREYALLNPSVAAQRRNGARVKTAVEDEEEESDKVSSDGLGSDKSESGNDDDESDSSDAGELNKFDPRAHPGQKNTRAQEAYARNRERNRVSNINLIPIRAQTNGSQSIDKNATFGQQRKSTASTGQKRPPEKHHDEGGMEISWTPASSSVVDADDTLIADGRRGKRKDKERMHGVETLGASLERGGGDKRMLDMSESDRKGRTQRRKGVRSGSKNVFRRMEG